MNRAQTHAEALLAEVRAWFDRNPYEVFGEYDPGPPEKYAFKVRFLEDIPATWGLLLGDFAHNARSALDHLADALVVFNGNEPTERTQFPIVVSPFCWSTQSARLNGASLRHIEIVESLQPYHRPDLYGWSSVWGSIEDPLAVLNRLSNVDKHRVLNATPATIQSIGWEVTPVRDIDWVDENQVEIPWDILEDGKEMMVFKVRACGPNPELKLARSETVEIRVQHRVDLTKNVYALRSVGLEDAIEQIRRRLRRIFEIFVGEFR